MRRSVAIAALLLLGFAALAAADDGGKGKGKPEDNQYHDGKDVYGHIKHDNDYYRRQPYRPEYGEKDHDDDCDYMVKYVNRIYIKDICTKHYGKPDDYDKDCQVYDYEHLDRSYYAKYPSYAPAYYHDDKSDDDYANCAVKLRVRCQKYGDAEIKPVYLKAKRPHGKHNPEYVSYEYKMGY